MTTPRLLGARYEIGETLGYGGMAEVHLGRDTRLGREVAVKVLRADLARDPTFQTRFRREAQAAASLNHPAIVAVYDTGEETAGTQPYIVMEYVEGRTLREVLKAEGRLLPRRAMEIVADICAALDFSHRNGIVHRDVKPGNVMITPSGAVKVMDFGIARAVADTASTVTATAAVIGTAQYLSPEQARGENVDARSDVYSTGCVLYELVTGQPPFTGDSPVAVAYQHVRETAPPPSSVNPDVPVDLDAIVMKAMAKNPANRYQTAAEMRADLVRAINGRAVAAEPVLTDEERTTVLGGVGAGGRYGAAGYGYPDGDQRRPVPVDDGSERGRRTAGWVALAVAVLLVLGLSALVTSRVLNRGNTASPTPSATARTVTVPPLTGQSLAAAKAAITTAGLTVGAVTGQASDTVPKDTVISQNPPANGPLAVGGKVGLTVSSGPDAVTVPQLVGLSVQSATRALRNAQLGWTVQNVDSKEPTGTVVGSDPAENSQAAKNSTVTLTVSSGRVEVPTVTNMSAADATTALNKKGFFDIKVQKGRPNDDYPEGIVFQQDPAAGQKATTSQRITLTVALPKPTQRPSPSGTPSGSPSGTPGGSPTTSPPTSSTSPSSNT